RLGFQHLLVAALFTLGIALAVLMFGSPAKAHAAKRSKQPVRIDRIERTEVNMINRFRAARGLPRLRIDATLSRTAEWHARDMARNQRFSHTDSRGRDPFRRLRAFGYPSSNTWRGENIAAGNPGAAATYRQWLNSPPHKANWLNSRYRAIGIARVRVAGSQYGYYWVTTFGSRVTGSR
ncbi:MAG: CAP domain-containing protein, partial [Gaiellales bacterium]